MDRGAGRLIARWAAAVRFVAKTSEPDMTFSCLTFGWG
jgi:hypothetical protein